MLSNKVPQNKYFIPVIFILISLGSFGLGWVVASENTKAYDQASQGHPLRADGFNYVSPLLLGDYGNYESSSTLTTLEELLSAQIQQAKEEGVVDSASVYYRDLTTGEQININGDEKYFPASLSKLPLMMAYYKQGETEPNLLPTRGQLQFTNDYNASQELQPEVYPISGNEYSLQELVEMMILYSDNAAFELLLARPGTDKVLQNMFDDLQLFYPFNQKEVFEVFTASEYSQFLRLLFNATYLSEVKSEEALKLLTEVSYKNGIVAGVSGEYKVAHKYGLQSLRDDQGNITSRQMHDCGIVYIPQNPYLLCVMTKSSTPELSDLENFISNTSKITFENID